MSALRDKIDVCNLSPKSGAIEVVAETRIEFDHRNALVSIRRDQNIDFRLRGARFGGQAPQAGGLDLIRIGFTLSLTQGGGNKAPQGESCGEFHAR